VLGQLGPEAVTLGAATLPVERFLDGFPVMAAATARAGAVAAGSGWRSRVNTR
jgi:hypothetical protein